MRRTESESNGARGRILSLLSGGLSVGQRSVVGDSVVVGAGSHRHQQVAVGPQGDASDVVQDSGVAPACWSEQTNGFFPSQPVTPLCAPASAGTASEAARTAVAMA
jgi:hypothetical protein